MARYKKEPDPVPEPPENLSAHARQLWIAILPDVQGPARRELLTIALLARDRMVDAGAIIRASGLTITSRRSKLTRAHPAIAIERDSRRQFIQIFRDLGLSRPASAWGGL